MDDFSDTLVQDSWDGSSEQSMEIIEVKKGVLDCDDLYEASKVVGSAVIGMVREMVWTEIRASCGWGLASIE